MRFRYVLCFVNACSLICEYWGKVRATASSFRREASEDIRFKREWSEECDTSDIRRWAEIRGNAVIGQAICVISGFRRGVNEILVLTGRYVTYTGSFDVITSFSGVHSWSWTSAHRDSRIVQYDVTAGV